MTLYDIIYISTAYIYIYNIRFISPGPYTICRKVMPECSHYSWSGLCIRSLYLASSLRGEGERLFRGRIIVFVPSFGPSSNIAATTSRICISLGRNWLSVCLSLTVWLSLAAYFCSRPFVSFQVSSQDFHNWQLMANFTKFGPFLVALTPQDILAGAHGSFLIIRKRVRNNFLQTVIIFLKMVLKMSQKKLFKTTQDNKYTRWVTQCIGLLLSLLFCKRE